jgi:hypothetical protein
MNKNSILAAGILGNRRGLVVTVALPLFFCALVYAFSLNGPLFFDDLPNITENTRLSLDGKTFDHWREAVVSADSGIFKRPVSMFTFALNRVFSGDFSPFALKATNLAIHMAIALLVYGFFCALLRAPASSSLRLSPRQQQWLAAAAAAIWLLHPLHVSTVLYVVQRMAQLSTLFVMAGLCLYAHVRLRWAAQGASVGEILGLALWLTFLTVLAVLSKENGALLPLLVLVTEVAFFRGFLQGRERLTLALSAWWVLLLPFIIVGATLLLAPEIFADAFRGREFSLEERLLTQLRVLWEYVGMLVVPNILQMGFFHDDVVLSSGLFRPLTTIVSLLAWITLIATSIVLRRRYPILLFAVLFFLVGHSLESSVLPLQIAFEHRNYLPSIGLTLLLSWVLVKLGFRAEGLKPAVIPVTFLVVLLALLAVRTSIWRDELGLARFNVVNHPSSPRANFFYGNALYKRFAHAAELGLTTQEEQALAVASRQYFERMYQIDPRDFAALVMLYQLDTGYFPGLAVENDWLGKMEILAATRRIQSSDRAALGALTRFALRSADEGARDRVGEMLRVVQKRYPSGTGLLALRYQYLKTQGPAGEEELRQLLERTLLSVKDKPQIAAFLVQLNGRENLDETYEAIREWMKRDTLRRELSLISRIFTN